MLDNLELLRNNPQLLQLFSHYSRPSVANPEAWHVRLTEMEDVGQADLVKLHGELIAFDFVDQNTGQMPCSYRLTRAGLKAIRQVEDLVVAEPGLAEVVNQAA